MELNLSYGVEVSGMNVVPKTYPNIAEANAWFVKFVFLTMEKGLIFSGNATAVCRRVSRNSLACILKMKKKPGTGASQRMTSGERMRSLRSEQSAFASDFPLW